jgi:hypothetical protein
LRSFKKLLLAAATTMVLAAGVAVSPASATVPSKGFGTQEANAPYLAWRGEHVRLGYCDEGVALGGYTVDWVLEDWSGDPLNGSVPVPHEIFNLRNTDANGCVYSDWVSQKAGVAFIKLVVSRPGVNAFEKQFMVGWMDLLTPTVTGGGTVHPGDITRDLIGCANPVYAACDPTKDPRHRISAVVKGNIPLKANFGEWGLGDHLTMPDDWARWAAVAARSWNDHLQSDWISNWDIHDDLTTVEGHIKTGGVQCDAISETNPGLNDAVDNCSKGVAFGGPNGGFSTVFGVQSTTASFGPFDPLYAHDTMLSNGTVDAGDAPMPAAQIDATIVENSGLPGDISGVGYLFPSYKTQVYSRNGFGTSLGHNFDAPFYYQYIPATTRPIHPSSPYGSPTPSGITGSGDPDGFNGFWFSGLYQNWQFAWSASYHPLTNSNCLNYRTFPGDVLNYRPLPHGLSAVTVYTDEHGEANVNFVPGLGYYFDNVGAIKNENGGCDLADPPVHVLGTAHITVQARYPYQPVTAADPSGTPVDFTVDNLFKKTLVDYSKGPGAENGNVRIILAHAQDIDGSPRAGEIVCWSSNDLNDNAIQLFPLSSAGGDIHDKNGNLVAHISYAQALAGFFVNSTLGHKCTTTDANGNTAIEISNSNPTTVDIVSTWVNELLFRDIKVNFGAPATGNLGQDTGPVTHVPTPAQIKLAVTASGAVGPVVVNGKTVKTKVIKSHKAKKALHKIRFARVVNPFHGKRMLQVRVNGKAGLVHLRITIKLGKTKHTYTRLVPANRKVAVKNLPIPVKTARVTVSLLGS